MSNIFKDILFLDIEAYGNSKIKEIGVIYLDKELRSSSVLAVDEFIKDKNIGFISGHNFVDFDIGIIKNTFLYNTIKSLNVIDTLPLSLLLFSEKTVHALPKNYKTEDDFMNNPVEDSKLTKELLKQLEEKFKLLEKVTRNIFYSLLKDDEYFCGFFSYYKEKIAFDLLDLDTLYEILVKEYDSVLPNKEYLKECVIRYPVQLSYIIALLTPYIEVKSHPPKILYKYPDIVEIQKKLCFDYEKEKKGLADFSNEVFGFSEFREFPRLNASIFDKPSVSQKEIVEASLKDESFLTILPTGGGKTFTFWLPAIIKAKAYKSLTVVISPLQALIEDHIKSFNSKVANFRAVAISGFMSPLERVEAIEQVINGEADILYIAPESLRSNSIFNILKNRLIERFVVDEAHCLSTWGNDFRQDYYYICEYIKELIEKKDFQEHIPISCFTATGKPSVISDIEDYFKDGLGITLEKYLAIPERKNLKYKSINLNEKEKYNKLLQLIDEHDGSTLVYIPSSTRKCDEVSKRLSYDTSKSVKSFHSKLDSQVKMQILKEYIEDSIDVIVATTAFGMGVDKANITNVIHYEISDSLESYAQEAGRGARDEKLEAFCPILFNEDDLDKHFASLNRSKLTANEINTIFSVIKRTKGDLVSKSAFEFARDAGWDVDDSSYDYETKVKTALLELEREGYINRKRNKINYFADSIASDAMQKLHTKLDILDLNQIDKDTLVIVLKSILGRGKTDSVQVDELAYMLGFDKPQISYAINMLKELEILGDSKDLSLEIDKKSTKKFLKIKKIEECLFKYLVNLYVDKVSIKDLNEYLHIEGISSKNEAELIKDILKNWKDKTSFIFKRINRQNDIWQLQFIDKDKTRESILSKHAIAKKVLEILLRDVNSEDKREKVDFSLKWLKDEVGEDISFKELDKTLLYLHYLGILELLYGRFINYSPMQIYKEEKLKTINKKYTKNDYKHRLENHYKTKIESIHIVGEYATRLKDDNTKAMSFLKDYFTLEYNSFKKKYNLLKEKLLQPITQTRYNKIFKQMSFEQQQIIADKTTKAMMILAGPGSGKTKVLVHKIASLILTEDIKAEQFMMLTFSKSAKMEFKNRLNQLIGSLSYDVEIQTFHSYALKLIARRVGKCNDVLNMAIEEATKELKNGEIKLPYISVLVLDEFQDVNEKSFAFIKAIYESLGKNLRIIAVGDDDQCIMDHAGANIKYIDKFKDEFGFDEDGNYVHKKYELSTNFRSYKNIVKYSNKYVKHLEHRYKEKDLNSDSSHDGKVVVISYSETQTLIEPVVEFVSKEKNRNIAILTYTNEDVMQIYSLLHENGIEAKYIIDRERFELKNIEEVFEFNHKLNSYLKDDDTHYEKNYFENTLEHMELIYKQSINLPLLKHIVNKFLDESDNLYISQWVAYLEEIKIEDFDNFKKDVVVTTIHKSKGMEFDKVFLLINNDPKSDKDRRVYYVGMTRAKYELFILRFGGKGVGKSDEVEYLFDNINYQPNAKVFTHVISLEDIWLNFYIGSNEKFVSGQSVEIQWSKKSKKYAIFFNNNCIAVFSRKFNELYSAKISEGYKIDVVFIEYVYVWRKEKLLIRHPLCKIIMKK